jgi:hypothetical protein
MLPSSRITAIERTQLGVRLESRLVKVLKGIAEYQNVTLGELLEDIVFHAFAGRDGDTCPSPFGKHALGKIGELKRVYDLDLHDAHASERFVESASDAKRRFFLSLQTRDSAGALAGLAGNPDLANVRDREHMSPLHHAARYGLVEVAAALITAGANLEATETEYRNTPLGWAAFYARADVAKLLVAAGANLDHRCVFGKTPLDYARAGAAGEWSRYCSEPTTAYAAVMAVLGSAGAIGTPSPSGPRPQTENRR